ncbi:YibE/F family protein [Photobacterium sp. BZF1]|uniref:YibE/F family protein n=1 Tax=Photobacterium sp. BZF1 TaxID=1904457 RepID=UPI0016534B12|nr:YibE/F family protein [Photobacterium sp. BZF1]MBC7001701.1 YibE/F family protein [Photobacterium sp. BZF1]
MKRIYFPFFIFCLATALFLFSPEWSSQFRPANSLSQQFVTATVESIEVDETHPDPMVPSIRTGRQRLTATINSGEFAGQQKQIENNISRLHNVAVAPSDSFIVMIREQANGTLFWPFNHNRLPAIVTMLGFLISLVVAFGGWQGVNSMVSLYFTASLIIGVLIPGIFAGWHPVPLTIGLVGLKIAVSFLLIAGWSRKSLIAMLGTISGVIAAGLCAQLFGEMAHLNGLYLDKGEDLLYLGGQYQVNVRWLLFVAIVISALGAVMDVAISMVSSYQELLEANPHLSAKQYSIATMRIGRDILGTMTNTLILAFVGSSLTTMMMIWGFQMPFLQFINIPAISLSIIHGLAGSIGLTLTIPATVACCNLLLQPHTTTIKASRRNEDSPPPVTSGHSGA